MTERRDLAATEANVETHIAEAEAEVADASLKIAIDKRTGRPLGDHGTAVQAIDFALNYERSGEIHAFLKNWMEGSLDEWPEFYVWLKKEEATYPSPAPRVSADRQWPRNPFRIVILKKQFAACIYCFFSRDKDFFRADGSRHTGNGVANAFWRGFDGVFKPGHWDGSKDTPAYASYRAGELIAAYERSITTQPTP